MSGSVWDTWHLGSIWNWISSLWLPGCGRRELTAKFCVEANFHGCLESHRKNFSPLDLLNDICTILLKEPVFTSQLNVLSSFLGNQQDNECRGRVTKDALEEPLLRLARLKAGQEPVPCLHLMNIPLLCQPPGVRARAVHNATRWVATLPMQLPGKRFKEPSKSMFKVILGFKTASLLRKLVLKIGPDF